MSGIFDYIKPDSKIPCTRCKESKMTMAEWPGPCKDCKSDPIYIKEQEEKQKQYELEHPNKGPHTYTGRKIADDIKYFVKDQAGQSFGVDVKGQMHLADNTRYDVKNDKNGWKAVGIKTKKD